MPNDDYAAQVSDKFVMLIVGSTVDNNEFQCTIFFVVDIRDLRRERDGIACIQQAVWRKRLLAMQHLAQFNAGVVYPCHFDARLQFSGKQKGRRRWQIWMTSCACSMLIGVDRIVLADSLGKKAQSGSLDQKGGGGQGMPYPFAIDHGLDPFVQRHNAGTAQSEVVLQGDASAFYLTLFSGATQLINELGALGKAGGA